MMPASSTWTSSSDGGGDVKKGIARPINGRAVPSVPLLECRGLSRAFDDKVVLRRMSLRVAAGEVVGLVAPNGTGKSTLLDLIAGVLEPDSGRVAIEGRDITDELTARRGVFYVPQSVKRYFAMKHPSLFCYLPELTVRDNLLAQHEGHRFAASLEVDQTLARYGLADVAAELPASLSVGMQQRLALARALGSPHPVLLLDEPLASVDRPTRLRLLSELSAGCGDRAVLYVTHDEAEIEALGGRLFHLLDALDSEEEPEAPPPPPIQAIAPATVAAAPAAVAAPAPARAPAAGARPAAAPAPPARPPPPARHPGPTNGGGKPILATPAQDAATLKGAAAAAVLEIAATALEAIARPPEGRRSVSEIVADLAGAMLAQAERLRGGP